MNGTYIETAEVALELLCGIDTDLNRRLIVSGQVSTLEQRVGEQNLVVLRRGSDDLASECLCLRGWLANG